MKESKVACDRPDGTLNIHLESEFCEFCASATRDHTPAPETQEQEKLIEDTLRALGFRLLPPQDYRAQADILRNLVQRATEWLRLAIEVKEAAVKPYREANGRLEADVERLTRERDEARQHVRDHHLEACESCVAMESRARSREERLRAGLAKAMFAVDELERSLKAWMAPIGGMGSNIQREGRGRAAYAMHHAAKARDISDPLLLSCVPPSSDKEDQ